MKFDDLFIFKAERFAVGVEQESGRFYLSIPVSSGFVDYEEYYEITTQEFDRFSAALDEMRALAVSCRARTNDARLMMKPGRNRGTPG